jgi:N-acyl-D-amino-acid deacylase
LRDRGLIREGLAADIVVFDEHKVGDVATYTQPHAYSTGFSFIMVNGEVVVENGKHTGARSGQALKGPAAQ